MKIQLKQKSGQSLHLGDTTERLHEGQEIALDGVDYVCVKAHEDMKGGVAEFIPKDEHDAAQKHITSTLKERGYKGPALTKAGSMLMHPASKQAETKTVEVPDGMRLVPAIPEPVPTEPTNAAGAVSANPELPATDGVQIGNVDAAAANVAAVADGSDAAQRSDRSDRNRNRR